MTKENKMLNAKSFLHKSLNRELFHFRFCRCLDLKYLPLHQFIINTTNFNSAARSACIKPTTYRKPLSWLYIFSAARGILLLVVSGWMEACQEWVAKFYCLKSRAQRFGGSDSFDFKDYTLHLVWMLAATNITHIYIPSRSSNILAVQHQLLFCFQSQHLQPHCGCCLLSKWKCCILPVAVVALVAGWMDGWR